MRTHQKLRAIRLSRGEEPNDAEVTKVNFVNFVDFVDFVNFWLKFDDNGFWFTLFMQRGLEIFAT